MVVTYPIQNQPHCFAGIYNLSKLCFHFQVPYLSTSTGDMERKIIQYEGNSSSSGQYLVEDYMKVDSKWIRKLTWKDEHTYVVTEIPLKKGARVYKLKVFASFY